MRVLGGVTLIRIVKSKESMRSFEGFFLLSCTPDPGGIGVFNTGIVKEGTERPR